MKSLSSNSFKQEIKVRAENLTMGVKETGYNNSQSKTFSAAALWNIQRQHTSINQRRRFL